MNKSLTLSCALLSCLFISACNLENYNGLVLFSLPAPHPSQGDCHYSASNSDNKITLEKQFVHCVLTDTYLWADNVDSQIDFSALPTSEDLLAELKYSELDHFSFITSAFNASNYFDSGVSVADPGLRVVVMLADENSYIWVFRSYQNSPAHQKGIVRGNRILSLNGKSVDQMRDDVEEFGTSWYDELAFSSQHENTVIYLNNEGVEHSVDVELFDYSIQTVEAAKTITLNSGEQGFYFSFNGFIAVAAEQINQALKDFNDQEMTFAVVDLRRNGGGYSYIANYIASILGGKTLRELPDDDVNFSFKQSIFNDKYASFNSSMPFYRSNQLPADIADKDFKLQKIVFLVDKGSCSASELLINSLQAYDYLFEIQVIGSQTCGKPYGMYGKRFGEKMLYAVENKSANAKGFGDYISGIELDCEITDLGSMTDWGDEEDPLMQAAFLWLNTGSCIKDNDDKKVFQPSNPTINSFTFKNSVINPNYGAFKVE